MMRLVHFLGYETTYRVSMLECLEENLVAPLVELLDLFAVHVGFAGVAEPPSRPASDSSRVMRVAISSMRSIMRARSATGSAVALLVLI